MLKDIKEINNKEFIGDGISIEFTPDHFILTTLGGSTIFLDEDKTFLLVQYFIDNGITFPKESNIDISKIVADKKDLGGGLSIEPKGIYFLLKQNNSDDIFLSTLSCSALMTYQMKILTKLLGG